jgi:hypothetical protein
MARGQTSLMRLPITGQVPRTATPRRIRAHGPDLREHVQQ